MHRSWNRSAAAIATSSWPGLSGPSVAARAGIGDPDKPGHDDGKTLAAIEQTFDFMGLHGCLRAVSEMCASRRACPGHLRFDGGGWMAGTPPAMTIGILPCAATRETTLRHYQGRRPCATAAPC